MEGIIDLNSLDLRELAGVVNIYPWFSLARKELCLRLAAEGNLSESQIAEAALYLSDPAPLGKLLEKETRVDYSDKNISGILDEVAACSRPRVVVAGGDYFSPQEYENEKKKGFEDLLQGSFPKSGTAEEVDFCTETLAGIYAEQGYFDQAKDMYNKLSLAYPEKSAYFADLIRGLNQENQKL